ncbi:MAG TPA: FAD-binding molybdopterin dehydrogenase, partial [Ancylobacter sp.]
MDQNTVREVKSPAFPEEIAHWPAGYAWLAGGTWLMSEPQLGIDTLIDLHGFGWPDLTASDDGIEIAATCPIATLATYIGPPEWHAAP